MAELPIEPQDYMPMRLVGVDCNPDSAWPIRLIFELTHHQRQDVRFCNFAYPVDRVNEQVNPGWVLQQLMHGKAVKANVCGGDYYLLDPQGVGEIVAYGERRRGGNKRRGCPSLFGFTDPLEVLFDILHAVHHPGTMVYIPRHMPLVRWAECFAPRTEVQECVVRQSPRTSEMVCSIAVVCHTVDSRRHILLREWSQMLEQMWFAVGQEDFVQAAMLRDRANRIKAQIEVLDLAIERSHYDSDPARVTSP